MKEKNKKSKLEEWAKNIKKSNDFDPDDYNDWDENY